MITCVFSQTICFLRRLYVVLAQQSSCVTKISPLFPVFLWAVPQQLSLHGLFFCDVLQFRYTKTHYYSLLQTNYSINSWSHDLRYPPKNVHTESWCRFRVNLFLYTFSHLQVHLSLGSVSKSSSAAIVDEIVFSKHELNLVRNGSCALMRSYSSDFDSLPWVRVSANDRRFAFNSTEAAVRQQLYAMSYGTEIQRRRRRRTSLAKFIGFCFGFSFRFVNNCRSPSAETGSDTTSYLTENQQYTHNQIRTHSY